MSAPSGEQQWTMRVVAAAAAVGQQQLPRGDWLTANETPDKGTLREFVRAAR